MSEQICPSCGKPISQCVCDIEDKIRKVRETPTEVIKIKHEFTGSPEEGEDVQTELRKTKEKLEEREEQLATLAYRKFETDKKALLDTIEDPQKRKYVDRFISDDPSKLEQVRATAVMLGKALEIGGIEIDDNPEDVETPPPKGHASAYREDEWKKGTIENAMAFIDSQYNILGNPESTDEEKKKANKTISNLLGAWISGRKQALAQGKRHFPRFAYMKCPECGKFIVRHGVTDRSEIKECPHCGWKKYVER